jgi:hypothetical protein
MLGSLIASPSSVDGNIIGPIDAIINTSCDRYKQSSGDHVEALLTNMREVYLARLEAGHQKVAFYHDFAEDQRCNSTREAVRLNGGKVIVEARLAFVDLAKSFGCQHFCVFSKSVGSSYSESFYKTLSSIEFSGFVAAIYLSAMGPWDPDLYGNWAIFLEDEEDAILISMHLS